MALCQKWSVCVACLHFSPAHTSDRLGHNTNSFQVRSKKPAQARHFRTPQPAQSAAEEHYIEGALYSWLGQEEGPTVTGFSGKLSLKYAQAHHQPTITQCSAVKSPCCLKEGQMWFRNAALLYVNSNSASIKVMAFWHKSLLAWQCYLCFSLNHGRTQDMCPPANLRRTMGLHSVNLFDRLLVSLCMCIGHVQVACMKNEPLGSLWIFKEELLGKWNPAAVPQWFCRSITNPWTLSSKSSSFRVRPLPKRIPPPQSLIQRSL